MSAEALKTVRASIEKKFGKGSVFTLSDKPDSMNITAIPSGSLTLDKALGVWGWPEGRIIELYGTESSGKTTILLCSIAEAQKMGKLCAFVDVEHSLDPEWAKLHGVDLDKLLVSQPDTAEQALDIVEALIRSEEVGLIGIDSVAALLPEAEAEEDHHHNTVGLQARLMSQAMRKLKGIAAKTKTTLIFINQVREKVGSYGNPITTPGGHALKFYASVRVEVRKADVHKDGKRVIGHRIKCKVVKNKVAAPYKEAEFDLYYDSGIDTAEEIARLAIVAGLIIQKGAWYKCNINGKEETWQGLKGVKDAILENPELKQTLIEALKQVFPVMQDFNQDNSTTEDDDIEGE
ncbi:Protein RecA [Moorella thermoacetica]|uniref:Protein RecA n=1 Tax=Neomoorella thermoacetica TaxID=1525 RepID=A0AAC9HK38_NEOTH|nr:recombinase RecA [Moorella thermoacetica]AOQ24561.1 recombinase A [Moorella thermoacetica]TYL12662.1 Protein RecA [Moorella thermoacetica]